MASNIEELYFEFDLHHKGSPEDTIRFYETNLILANIQSFQDKKELGQFIAIITTYLHALHKTGRYNEAIDRADQHLKLVDHELIRLDAPELKDNWYNGFWFFRGMAYYSLRDYKNSALMFKYLTNVDPRNDNYRLWFNYASHQQKLWLFNTINIVCGVLILVYFLGEEYIESFAVRIAILSVASVGLTIMWSYEYFMKRNFRRMTGK